MSKIKTILRGGVLAAFVAIFVAAPASAVVCTGEISTGEYAGLYVGDAGAGWVRCAGSTMATGEAIWAKSTTGCAKAASLAANPDKCDGQGLSATVQLIINMIIFAIGLVAVIMVIMGGVQYSTSQGASDKVKKAKDTIMYGIIGLVVAILAFAIVNFVLTSITAAPAA